MLACSHVRLLDCSLASLACLLARLLCPLTHLARLLAHSLASLARLLARSLVACFAHLRCSRSLAHLACSARLLACSLNRSFFACSRLVPELIPEAANTQVTLLKRQVPNSNCHVASHWTHAPSFFTQWFWSSAGSYHHSYSCNFGTCCNSCTHVKC